MPVIFFRGLLPALMVVLSATIPQSLVARDIAGVSIGMDRETAVNILARLGTVDMRDEDTTKKATTLSVGDLEVLVCGNRVVGVQRLLAPDFHAFGRIVESEKKLAGFPFDQSFYSLVENGKPATSLSYFWRAADRSVYSVHFSQFGSDYETVEILDYPREDYDQLPDLCGYDLGDRYSPSIGRNREHRP